jgi:hypothetical protein
LRGRKEDARGRRERGSEKDGEEGEREVVRRGIERKEGERMIQRKEGER